ncbi:MAG: ice-binding family protein [Alkalimonas sp.]|nr:ice-binding family protein [Alkalimonas sp.]
MKYFHTLLQMILLLCVVTATPTHAVQCDEIWTEAVRSNSPSPATINYPAPNPDFPEPLQAIDYYFSANENWLIEDNTVRNSVEPTARLFINGNLTIGTNTRLNNGGPAENFILVVSGSLTIQSDSRINGFILAGGAITLNDNVQIQGGVTAKGAVSNFGALVQFDANAVSMLDGGGLCDATPMLPVLAIDDFENYAPGSIAGRNNGIGWGGAWTGAANRQQIIDTSSSPLEFQAANDEWILGGNRSLELFSNSGTAATRPLQARHHDDVVYVSMLMRFEVGPGNNRFAALWFDQTGFSNIPNIGLKTNRGNGSGPEDLFVRTRTNNDVYSASIENGETYFVVGRLSKSTSGASQPYDRFELWVNPGTLTNKPSTPDVVSVGASNISSFEQIGFRTENLGSNDRVELDRLAIGTTWSDVVTPSERPLQCFTDDFAMGQLSDDWVTSRSSGNFTPSIVDGRLRMTQAVANQATSATYQRLFPAADNLVVVEFDYFAWSPAGGQGADGVAIILSDADVTPQPGSFGGSLGYAQRNNGDPGFAGGWLGIGLDEFGNFSNQTEGRVGGIGFQRNAVAIRGSESSQYRYLRGTGGGLTPSIDQRPSPSAAPNHRYRIIIDSRVPGQAVVSVERDIKNGDGFQTLVNPFNALAIPEQGPVPENFFLSFTGSTGGSNNNHELDNISICALRSSPVGQQIDHFEFDHTGQALTCQPELLTVRACLNADCSQLYTDPVTATLSPQPVPDGEWVGGHVISFSGGSTTVPLRRSTEGTVTVGVTGSVPSTRPLSTTLCRAGGGSLNQANCTLSFASSGFVMEIPDGVAGVPEEGILLRAVREGNDAQACVPAFSDVTRNVLFWSDYITPDATGRPASLPVQVQQQDAGMSSANALNVPLSFNQDGEATLAVNYSDAGRVQLNARYIGSTATEDPGLVMNGANQFSRRPYGLCIQSAGDCASANASCPVFRRAGEPFELSISAHAWQDGGAALCALPVTPNYQQSGIALSHSLVEPVDGVAGTLSALGYVHQAAVDSTTVVTQSVSEVGVFRFQATPPSNAYFGMTVPAATSEPIGRFIPDRFELRQAALTPGCGNFSYMGQPFNLSFELEAKAVAGQRTQNYQGNFAPLLAGGTQLVAEQSNNGDDLSARLVGMTDLTWLAGEAVLFEQAIRFNRAEAGPDGPYPELAIGLQYQDADGVVLAELDMNTSSAGDCIAALNCHAKQLAAAQDLRFGRLQLANAFGPEFDPLPLQLTAQYWNGDRFSRNRDDQCSLVDPAQLVISGMPVVTADGLASVLVQGQNEPQTLWLQPPNQSGSWSIEYQTEPWLQFNWSGGTEFDEDPQAEAIFGRYRGNPRRIFWREPFPQQ